MNIKPRIKFYCRSFDKELYLLSKRLYEDAGYPCVRLTDQTADGYFFTMLADEECDIAINVDEDCFITDLDAVLQLADRVVAEKWINAGCPDANPACPRGGDPQVTNPFFNVFNLKEIRKEWNAYRLIPELKQGSYLTLEPYYNYFHWILRTFPGRTLYLDGYRHPDRTTTVLQGYCLHTWFARLFNPSLLTRLFEGNDKKDVDHQLRINAIIDEAYRLRGIRRERFNVFTRIGFKIDGAQRWAIKIPQRIMNWPNKLRKKLCPK